MKLWYKFFNKNKYQDFKNEKRVADNVKYYNSRIYNQILEIQKKIEDNKELSFLHSGQLGDVVFGSFNKTNHKEADYKPYIGAYSNKLLHKVNLEKDITLKYDNAELFNMYQRGFNGANGGLVPIQQYTETMSPFYDIDLLYFAMTIPVKYRSKQKIYKKWILKKYPGAANYIWEKTGEKISAPALYIKNKILAHI